MIPINKSTSTSKLIEELCEAFNKYKRIRQNNGTWNGVYESFKNAEDDLNKILDEKVFKDKIRKRLERLFNKDEKRVNVLEQLKIINKTIIFITESFGDKIELDDEGNVKILNKELKFISDNIYKIYLNSVNGKIIQGALKLDRISQLPVTDLSKLNNLCSAEIFRKNRNIRFNGTYTISNSFLCVTLNNDVSDNFEDDPISLQLIFREGINNDNLFVGTAQLKIRRRASSHLCVMTSNDSNNLLATIVEFILDDRSSFYDIVTFDFSEHYINYDSIPKVVKMWANVRDYNGYYQGCFIHPSRKIIIYSMRINQSGKVEIYWNRGVFNSCIGFIRAGGDGDTKKIIINANYNKNYMDFGLKIFLQEYNYENELVLKGAYCGILSEGGGPHAGKFAMREVSVNEFETAQTFFSSEGLSLKDANSYLKKYDFFKYFKKDEIAEVFS